MWAFWNSNALKTKLHLILIRKNIVFSTQSTVVENYLSLYHDSAKAI